MTFQLTETTLRFLLSERGRGRLSLAADLPLSPASLPGDVQALRRHLSADEAAAVIEQVLLRRRGAQKFRQAARMLFARDALEQATPWPVARHRAARYAGFGCVADLGCGLGGDLLELAQTAGAVWAVDLNPLRLALARHNAAVCGLESGARFAQADALRLPFAGGRIKALFADPARRTAAGRRTFSPYDYQPPLFKLLACFSGLPMGVKVGPGLDFKAIPQAAEVEVVSLGGAVKEAVLWSNGLSTPGVRRRATLLPHGLSLTDAESDDCPLAPLTDFIFEPDGAVIRAGLVAQLGARLGLHRLDERLAYLSGPAIDPTPWGRGYHILARLPLRLKRINRYLKENHISRVNVKQRGAGLKPEVFHRKLKPAKTGLERTLILLKIQDDHLALLCEPVGERENIG